MADQRLNFFQITSKERSGIHIPRQLALIAQVEQWLLDDWEAARRKFVKVFPHEYRRALSELHAKQTAAKSAASAKVKAAA